MQTITATFEDGVLKPRQPLNLPAHAEVRVTVELLPNTPLTVGKLHELRDIVREMEKLTARGVVSVDTSDHGIANAADNCPRVANPDQGDLNHNGIGTLCDAADQEEIDEVMRRVDQQFPIASPTRAESAFAS